MESTIDKIDVLHPINLFNTVGKELRDFFIANNLPINYLKEININPEELDSKIKFTKQQIRKIVELSGIKEIEGYLINFQEDYLASKARAEEDYSNNIKIYKKVKHLAPLLKKDFNDGIDLLEDISNFLEIQNESEIFEKVKANIALYKISNFEPDVLNLYAWLKRGEIDFYKLKLPNYNADLFQKWINKREWERNLSNINYLKELPQEFSEFGIGLIFTPYLNKTVYGAVRWFDDKPLIQVSDKGKCLASVWYSLFHEFGHVIRHRNDMIFEGSLDLPKSKITKKEQEANAFAYEYLFKGDSLRKYIFNFHGKHVADSFIKEQSTKFNVHNMFVAFWMNKAQIKNLSFRKYLPQVSFD